MTDTKDEDKYSITIPSYKLIEGVVFYHIVVHHGAAKWTISKRFSQFEQLQTCIFTDFAVLPAGCELPPKRMKIFTAHDNPAFIEERRCLLEAYLKRLLTVEKMRKYEPMLQFLDSNREDYNVEESKLSPDDLPSDVEITDVRIPATRQMSDHTLFQIDCLNHRKRKSFQKWTVLKRFGQFVDVDATIRASLSEQPEVIARMPAAPERRSKLIYDHLDANFVEQRRVVLENYLNKLLRDPVICRNKTFLTFLGVADFADDE